MDFLVWIIIGVIAGWLAGKIMKGAGFGLVGDLVVGLIGSLLGGWLFHLFGLSGSGFLGSLVTATVGAMAFLTLLRFLKKTTG